MSTMNGTHIATGLRGDYSPCRGDVTGARFLSLIEEKDEREVAINHTVNALREDPLVTVIPEKGGASWAVPTHVVELIRLNIARGTL